MKLGTRRRHFHQTLYSSNCRCCNQRWILLCISTKCWAMPESRISERLDAKKPDFDRISVAIESRKRVNENCECIQSFGRLNFRWRRRHFAVGYQSHVDPNIFSRVHFKGENQSNRVVDPRKTSLCFCFFLRRLFGRFSYLSTPLENAVAHRLF